MTWAMAIETILQGSEMILMILLIWKISLLDRRLTGVEKKLGVKFPDLEKETQELEEFIDLTTSKRGKTLFG